MPGDSPVTLLLRSVLGDDGTAHEAWHALRPVFDLQHVPPGWHPLMPMLYTRLRDITPPEEFLPRLKGLVRHTWTRNQLLLDRVPPLLRLLDGAGVPAALMQAVPLALHYYPRAGLRAVPYLELLLPPESARAGARALYAAGWRRPARVASSSRKGTWLVGPDTDARALCLLRPRILPGLPAPRPTTLIDHAGGAVPALDPTDELLVTCARPDRDGAADPLLRLVDAAMILRAAPDSIDWARLADDAARARAVLRLRDTARQLERIGLPLPAAFRGIAQRTPVSLQEAVAHRAGRGVIRLRRVAGSVVGSDPVRRALRSLVPAVRPRRPA